MEFGETGVKTEQIGAFGPGRKLWSINVLSKE